MKITKLIALLYIGLGISTHASQNPLQDNPIWKFFKENGQAMMESLGDAADRTAKEVRDYVDKRQQEIREKQKKLETIVNDSKATPEARNRAQKELEKMDASAHSLQDTADQMVKGGAELTMKMANAVMDTGKMYAEQHIKEQAEIKKVAIEANQRAKADIEKQKEQSKENLEALRQKLAFFQDRKNMYTLGIGAVCIAGAYFGAREGATLLADMIRHYYRNPTLAQETSLLTMQEKMSELIWGKKLVSAEVTDVVLESGLQAQIATIAAAVKDSLAADTYLPNILFYGPPGTGKTMISQRIARASGLEYIYFAASSLDQFSVDEALIKLTELFEFAKKSSKKLMIVIDEAELLFADRGGNLSEKTSKMLTHLLTYTGTESKDYMIITLTNRPQDLDSAVLSRMDYKIKIDAPALEQRKGILKKYVTDYLLAAQQERRASTIFTRVLTLVKKPELVLPITVARGSLDDAAINNIAQRIDGFVGRDISKMILKMQAMARVSKNRMLTKEMVEMIVADSIKQYQSQKDGFKLTV